MAVLDAFIAISEDLIFKFSRGSMPPDPLVCSRLGVRIAAPRLENPLRRPWPAIVAYEELILVSDKF